MVNKKNLNNLGFTIYEVLAVITIIGIIASMTIPVIIINQKKYNQLVFEQKCKMYEKVFRDTHDLFQNGYYGSTALTEDVKIRIPFIMEMETEEDMSVDILDTTYVFYFLYETLVESEFGYNDYEIDYTPANITSTYKFFPSTYTLSLEDNVKIELGLNAIVSEVNNTQLFYILNVVIRQNDFEYEFEL